MFSVLKTFFEYGRLIFSAPKSAHIVGQILCTSTLTGIGLTNVSKIVTVRKELAALCVYVSWGAVAGRRQTANI